MVEMIFLLVVSGEVYTNVPGRKTEISLPSVLQFFLADLKLKLMGSTYFRLRKRYPQ